MEDETVRILLITGPSGHMQGWGDMATTMRIRDALTSMGAHATISYVESAEALLDRLKARSFDIVWSSLYYISSNVDFIGTNSSGVWVHNMLDRLNIPYVGSCALSMRRMLDKSWTTAILAERGVDVPLQHVVKLGADAPADVAFPAFVKPCFESESTGVEEKSVVSSQAELKERLAYVHREFSQTALVEEYLPGREFTVSMLGNGVARELYPVENVIDPAGVTRFPVVTKELKLKGWLDFRVPQGNADRLRALAASAAAALDCADHIRIDMREDANGHVKVIEVNGIPGLNPSKSRSLVIHGMYHASATPDELFKNLIRRIVVAGLARYGLLAGEAHTSDLRRSAPAEAPTTRVT
jgi:D-alanine-D-alanine ligase